MAIFNNVPGLEAEVVVDGEPLHEYEDDDAEPDTMTKYIEALSDKEFALRFIFKMDTPVDHGVQVRMDIDGLVSCVVYSPDDLRKPWYKRGKTFLKNGQHFRQNYRFTALNIVEEVDGSTKTEDIKKDLDSKGSIYLEFRFITNMGDRSQNCRNRQANELRAIGAVPEKALKGDARSHQATLSEPQQVVWHGVCSRYDIVDKEPFAKVNFKYRSLAALKALRIINEDEAEDVEPLDHVPEDAMTPEQLREALRHSRRRENENRRVKQENTVRRNIKRERVETVDRIDDDDEVIIVQSRIRKRPRGEPEVIVLD